LIALLISCEDHDEHNELEGLLNHNRSDVFESLGNSDRIYNPKSILVLGPYLVLKDFDGAFHYSLFDKRSGKYINSFGKEGRGPGEMHSNNKPQKIGANKIICYSINQRTAFFFDLEQVVLGNRKPYKTITPTFSDSANTCSKMTQINDGLYFGTGYFDQGRYCIFDSLGLAITCFGKYPTSPYLINKSNRVLGHAFQSGITFSTMSNRVATCTEGVVEIIDFSEKSGNIIFSKKYYEPKFVDFSEGASLRVAIDSQQKIRIGGNIAGCEKYFALGYSNLSLRKAMESHGDFYDHVIIYDWTGSILVKMQLDQRIRCFDVDGEGKYLYGIATDSNSLHPKIVSTRIDGI
jgi:hypothetical protein